MQQLLDAVVDYLPSPLDMPPVPATTPRRARTSSARPPDEAPFSALAFKIMADPFVGHLTFVRVYSGQARGGHGVYNSAKDKRERSGRLLQHARQQARGDRRVLAGDIGAVVGLKDVTTGDTLCDADAPDRAREDGVPRAGHRNRASSRRRTADQGKLAAALQQLAVEDPTFRVAPTRRPARRSSPAWASCTSRSSSTGMMREYKVEANVGKPQVAYRETITGQVEAKASTSARPAAGPVRPRLAARRARARRAAGFVFVNKLVGGAIPSEYIPPIEKGVAEAMQAGVLAGYPMVDLKVSCSTAATTTWTPTRWPSRSPAPSASRTRASKAGPILLEPIMEAEVVTPEDFMGNVIGDLSAAAREDPGDGRRGRACR